MYRAKWFVAGALLFFAGTAWGQTIVVDSPVVVPARSGVVYYPPTVSAPVVVNSPVVTYSAPVTTVTETIASPAPVVTYRVPYATSTYVGAPTTVYGYPSYPSYVIGRGSVGQPTFYVPGQPVRNTFRFFVP